MDAIRVVDRKQLARVLLGAAAILVVAGLATLLWPGPMGTLLRYSLARPCQADAPSADCVATLPATVTSTWTDYGEGEPYETLLSLDVPGAPAGAARNQFDGDIEPWLFRADAERLRVAELDGLADRVEVTMFGGEVIAVTSAAGETAATRYGLMPTLAAGELLLAVLVLGGVFALVRRRQAWPRPAVGVAAAGVLAGLLVVLATSGRVAEGWTVPVLGGAILLVGVPVAVLSARRLREPFGS